jgi:hypothetical protein
MIDSVSAFWSKVAVKLPAPEVVASSLQDATTPTMIKRDTTKRLIAKQFDPQDIKR